MAVSGNSSNDPIRKPMAPMSVNATETVVASKFVAHGATKANKADIINPIQPRRLMNVTHQEMLVGFHAQWV